MATRKLSKPEIVKGSHLTVMTDAVGKTTLIWNDEQLLKEVREAIATVEQQNMKPAVRAKAVRSRKAKPAND